MITWGSHSYFLFFYILLNSFPFLSIPPVFQTTVLDFWHLFFSCKAPLNIRILALYGKNTDSALPLLNLLDLLTVENIFIFRLLQFSHQWLKKSSLAYSITTFVMLVTFTHTTLDMLLKATSIKHASRLILEKQPCRLWQLTIGKNYHMTLKISILPFSQEKLNSIY